MLNWRMITFLQKALKINAVQALHISDILDSKESRISWSYLPPVVRRSLRPLLDRRIVAIGQETVEGESQIYEWLGLGQVGLKMIEVGLHELR